MFSAISFGVFCREAPSTSAIIRSTKVSPGFGGDAHDDPVGQHPRAAGDRAAVAAGLADDRRRLAGDRRLVDATRCPRRRRRRRGSTSPALDHDDVAERGRPTQTSLTAARSSPASASRRADAVRDRRVRVWRSASACALPRPSATASARFAKSTVSQSQTAMPASQRRAPLGLARRSAMRRVVSTAPTSTMNMTGLRHMVARVELAQRAGQRLTELRRVEQAAGDPRRARSARGCAGTVGERACVVISAALPRADPARARGSR